MASSPFFRSPDEEYVAYKVKQFFMRMERRALKVGAFMAMGIVAMTGPPIYSAFGLEGLILPGVAGVLMIFTAWVLAVTTVPDTLEFVQEINREHDAAVAKVR